MEGKTKTAEDILNFYLSRCHNVHNVSMSDKFRGYLISALNEYATQEREKAVKEFKNQINNFIESKYPSIHEGDYGYGMMYSFDLILEVIEKIK
jgi:hypothetical protein